MLSKEQIAKEEDWVKAHGIDPPYPHFMAGTSIRRLRQKWKAEQKESKKGISKTSEKHIPKSRHECIAENESKPIKVEKEEQNKMEKE